MRRYRNRQKNPYLAWARSLTLNCLFDREAERLQKDYWAYMHRSRIAMQMLIGVGETWPAGMGTVGVLVPHD